MKKVLHSHCPVDFMATEWLQLPLSGSLWVKAEAEALRAPKNPPKASLAVPYLLPGASFLPVLLPFRFLHICIPFCLKTALDTIAGRPLRPAPYGLWHVPIVAQHGRPSPDP